MIRYLSEVDTGILQYLYTHRDLTTTLFFIDVSELGSTVFVCGITLCIALLLVLRRKIPYAIALTVSVWGAWATALLIKEAVHRARPEVAYRAYIETGFSFPSGHATLAAVFYGLLICLVWRTVPPGLVRTAALSVLTVLIALIAFSRLYLGVHYLSDVLAGLLLGAAFACLGAMIVRKFDQRG